MQNSKQINYVHLHNETKKKLSGGETTNAKKATLNYTENVVLSLITRHLSS